MGSGPIQNSGVGENSNITSFKPLEAKPLQSKRSSSSRIWTGEGVKTLSETQKTVDVSQHSIARRGETGSSAREVMSKIPLTERWKFVPLKSSASQGENNVWVAVNRFSLSKRLGISLLDTFTKKPKELKALVDDKTTQIIRDIFKEQRLRGLNKSDEPKVIQFNEDTNIRVVDPYEWKGDKSTIQNVSEMFKAKTNFTNRFNSKESIKQEGWSKRSVNDENTVAKQVDALGTKLERHQKLSSREVSFEKLKGKEKIGVSQITYAAKNRLYDLAKEKGVFASGASRDSEWIANELGDLLRSDDSFANIDDLKSKLMVNIDNKNTKKELIDKETFSDLVEGNQRIPYDLINAPEYKEIKKSYDTNKWNDAEEKTITFTQINANDLSTYKTAVEEFFADKNVQAVLERYLETRRDMPK